jgi:oligopeptide/dipeptide ABC transporter ATP-binding protein
LARAFAAGTWSEAVLIEPLLSVKNLSVGIRKGKNLFPAVNDISFDLGAGEITGIVGESGCGKSLTALSIAGLLPEVAEAMGTVQFNSAETQGRNLLGLKEDELCRIRGRHISMIFQEPMSSLNPLQKIGPQIAEALEIHSSHKKKNKAQNRLKVLDLMEKLGLQEGERLTETYPWRLSGGMCQRVMIALAMICGPRLLIADEPSTALDKSTQDEVLKLLQQINRESGTAILLISHDLGIISRVCHKVMVMYAGKIVERGGVEDVFSHPAHEYTKGLLGALPERARKGKKLRMIPGRVPSIEEIHTLSSGCAFAPRCAKADEKCRAAIPQETIINENHLAACKRAGQGGPS